MSWITTELKPCDYRTIDRLGDQYRIGNGYMEYRGTPEEFTRDQKMVTSVFCLNDRWSDAINIPNGGYVQVFVNGTALHVLSAGVLAHSQALDVTHDIHYRRTVFSIDGGGMVLVRSRRFASIMQPHLLCLEYMIQPSVEGPIVVRTGIDGDVWHINGPHMGEFSMCSQAGTLSITTQARPSRVPVAVSEIALLPEGECACLQEERSILHEITVRAAAYQPVTITKFVAVYTGIDSADPLIEGTSLCCRAAQMGFEKLYREHCGSWEERLRVNGRPGGVKNTPLYGLPDPLDSC